MQQDRSSLSNMPLTAPKRLLLLAINGLPLLHLASAGTIIWLTPGLSTTWIVLLGLLLLYLPPPICARLILWLSPIRNREIPVGSREFFVWWAANSLQIIFTRLTFLEECLRLLPGFYSTWLRLWGARIGRVTYWAPGVVITDRSFIEIGNDVVFGAGVRINPHVMARDNDGQMKLYLAPVVIGNGVVVGGYSLLTAGTEISDNDCTRAFLISPPFSCWEAGKRVKKQPTSTQQDQPE